MKQKIFCMVMAICMLLPLIGCNTNQAKKEEPLRIAVVRNLGYDDHTLQFFEGAVSQGQALGYTVDTFATNGDDEEMKSRLQKVIGGDYDGLIISHGKEEYSYDFIKSAVDKGMKIVTFDTVFKEITGVTATAQDDAQLARLSLDQLIAKADAVPAKVIKVWYDKSLSPFAKRDKVYQGYEQKGLIKTVAEIHPEVPANQLQSSVAAQIKKLSGVSADGIWAAWDELAKEGHIKD